MLAADTPKFLQDRFPTTELLLLLVAIFWGTSYGMTKNALVFTGVFMFLAIRFLLTFAVLLPATISDFRTKGNKDWFVALPTGLILLLIFCCEVLGVAKTSATNAAVLISLSAIFTVFVEAVATKKAPDVRYLVLGVTSVLGVILLTHDRALSIEFNLGDWLIISAALLRALMVNTTKGLTQGKQITTLSLTALQSLIVGLGAICVIFVQRLNGIEASIPTSTSFWFIVVYLVIFCTIFAFFVQNYAVRRLSPTKVSLLMGSELLFGAIFAFLWLGESLTFVQWLGACIIFASVTLVTFQQSDNGD